MKAIVSEWSNMVGQAIEIRDDNEMVIARLLLRGLTPPPDYLKAFGNECTRVWAREKANNIADRINSEDSVWET